jgi:uncharacterized protein YkwD
MFPLRIRPLAVLAVCASFLVMPASSFAAPCPDADAKPREVSQNRFARATVCLVNKERAKHGLRKLRLQERLSKAARSHTTDMVRHRYFSHTSRSGGNVISRLRGLGYMRGARRWTVGENLAWGAGGHGTPRSIVAAWMRSPGHRSNILASSFREMGIGIAFRAPRAVGRAAATVTTTFGARS